MPIPEPSIYRKTNLSKQQQKEQIAALYGVQMPVELSFEEVERMRQIVQMHDSQRQPMQTIDLNNPPKQPYKFQKFPMMIYSTDGQNIIVKSEQQLQDALAEGWLEQPPMTAEAVEQPLAAKYQSEAAAVQEHIDQLRRRVPGRKGTEAA